MTELLNRPADSMPDPESYDLDDRFRVGAPPTLLTGVQKTARLLVEHRALDRRRGLHTVSFVSGYQGSPLGGLDKMLADMQDVLDENDTGSSPASTKSLAATSVWGSQIDLPAATPTHDGVTGSWYGKGPGVDRAIDAAPCQHVRASTGVAARCCWSATTPPRSPRPFLQRANGPWPRWGFQSCSPATPARS